MAELQATVGTWTGEQAVIDTAQQAVKPEALDPKEVYGVAVPSGAQHKVIDLEAYLDTPRRATGTVHPATRKAFVEYVKEHADDAATTIWIHPTQGKVVAVLNDHDAEAPGFGDHRAELVLVKTPEWERWTRLDGKLVPLDEFAEHIEQSVPEIVAPDGATMLELAQSFSATTTAEFQEAKRLHSGEIQTKYAEEVKAKAGQTGEIEIPKEIELALAPYIGTDPFKVKAQFRFRLRGGELRVGYQLIRPQDVLEEVLIDIETDLAGEFKRVYTGAPRG